MRMAGEYLNDLLVFRSFCLNTKESKNMSMSITSILILANALKPIGWEWLYFMFNDIYTHTRQMAWLSYFDAILTRSDEALFIHFL